MNKVNIDKTARALSSLQKDIRKRFRKLELDNVPEGLKIYKIVQNINIYSCT